MNNYLFCLHQWNSMSPKIRAKLLVLLGFTTFHSVRAYPFVPVHVRGEIQKHMLKRGYQNAR